MRCLFCWCDTAQLFFFCLIINHFLEHELSRASCVSNACTLDEAWIKNILTDSRKVMTTQFSNDII